MKVLDDPFNLAPIWDVLLDIHAVFADICSRHHLTYYVAYGTALGAVRHNGFIPWDDDFDVMMPRKDYEKLRLIVEKELPSSYRFVDYKNTVEYPNAFAKVVDIREEVLTSVQKATGRELNQGLFIDIFPVDGISSGSKEREDEFRKLHSLRQVEWHFLPVVSNSWIKTCVKRSIGWFARLAHPSISSLQKAIAGIDDLAQQTNYDLSEFVGCVTNRTFWVPKRHAKSVLGSPKYVPFMDTEVPVVEDVDAYLTVEYGDYMKLPPLGNRQPSHDKQPIAIWRM